MNKIFLILIFLVSLVEAKILTLIHYDPFRKAKVLLKTEPNATRAVKHKKKFLRIDAILNNKVYINGRFYGVGKRVYGYKIVTIANKYIKVKKNRRILIIPLIKSNYFDIIKKMKL